MIHVLSAFSRACFYHFLEDRKSASPGVTGENDVWGFFGVLFKRGV